jgi:hypothetical protein
MSIQRNDITVAVTPDGRMWIAQGNPALDALSDDAHGERGLFFSQVVHRCAALTPDGWRIMTPTQAKEAGYKYTSFPRRFGRACGSPALVGLAQCGVP